MKLFMSAFGAVWCLVVNSNPLFHTFRSTKYFRALFACCPVIFV